MSPTVTRHRLRPGARRTRGLAALLLATTLLAGACGRSNSGGSSTPNPPAGSSAAVAPGSGGSGSSAATASSALTDSSDAGSSATGSSGGPGSATSGAGGGSAADMLPDDIRSAGVLKVATAEGYPPMEMYKEGTTELVGVDPELGALLAEQLGLEFEITNASFPGLIPGLQSGQWDLAMSSMSDTEERRQAVDFVDYFVAGGSIMVVKGNPEGIKGIADLCGKAVVGGKGSSNLAILTKYSEASCPEKMKISESEDAPTGLLQLDTQRAVATMVDYPVAVLLAEQTGKYEVLAEQYESGPWGIAIDKKDRELTEAVAAALSELMANGKYGALLEKYGVTGSAVESAVINDGK